MNTEPSSPPDGIQPKTGLSMSDKKAGCLVVSGLIVVALLLVVAIYFGWKYFSKESATEQKTETTSTETPKPVTSPDKKKTQDSISSSKKIEGKILASATSLNEKGEVMLWIISEGVYSGKSVDKSLNTISLYDPVNKNVLRKITGRFSFQGFNYRFCQYKDKVWFITETSSSTDTDNLIFSYDSQTGDEILNTKKFIENNSELTVGISSFSLDNQFAGIKITTKDGNKYVYKIKEEKLISEKEWSKEKYYPKNETKIPYYTLSPEPYTEGRMNLIKLLVPKSKVPDREFKSRFMQDIIILNFYSSDKKEISPGQVFFSGQVFYFDEEIIALMSHKDADKNSESILSCLKTDGKELWIKPGSEIFSANISYNISVDRLGNSLIFTANDKGVKAFDYKTGEELWNYKF